MATRYDAVLSHKDKNDKTRYTKVGVMFVNDKGQMSMKVDPGVSIATPEGVWLNFYEPKARDDQRGNGAQRQASGGYEGPDED